MLEHDFEPIPGLPQALPRDERLLWQGRSDFRSLLRHTFHARKLTAYFGVLIALHVVFKLRDGVPVSDALAGALGFALLAGAALGVLYLYARRFSQSTVFSLTNRRIIIRSGIAVPLTMNLPYSRIDALDLRQHADGTGDIAICPQAGSRVSYILLWPLVKPWRLIHVRPVLRAVS